MKVRFEIIWKGNPFLRKNLVNTLCKFDMLFGVSMIVLYTYKLIFPHQEPSIGEITGRGENTEINAMMGIVYLLLVNVLQVVYGALLYRITKLDYPNPARCFCKAKSWYSFSVNVYPFSVIKCMIEVSYLFSVTVNPFIVILSLINCTEAAFKVYIFIKVCQMMKDLRETLKYHPEVKFIPVDSLEDTKYLEELSKIKEKLSIKDVNANFETV